MKLNFIHRAATGTFIRALAVLVLCASTAGVYGFDDKNKDKKNPPPPPPKPSGQTGQSHSTQATHTPQATHTSQSVNTNQNKSLNTGAQTHNSTSSGTSLNTHSANTNAQTHGNVSSTSAGTNQNLNNRPLNSNTQNQGIKPLPNNVYSNISKGTNSTANQNLGNKPVNTTTGANPNVHTNQNLGNKPMNTTTGTNPNFNTNQNLNNRQLNTNTGANQNLGNKPMNTTGTNPNFNTNNANMGNRSNLTPTGNTGRVTTPQTYRAPTINTSKLPQGSQVSRGPNGMTNVTTHNGGQMQLNSQGQVSTFKSANGATATFRSNGAPQKVQINNNKTVVNNYYGGKTVIVNRPNNTVVVSNGAGRGYVQRPFAYGGHSYYQRTYVYGGHSYSRVYMSYGWHGHYYPYYVRPRFYRPAFYGWAYNPWPAPIAYGWGWGVGTPWFGFYGGYWRPYPVYRSPAYWLTDFIISSTLMAAYDARVQAQAQAAAAAQYQSQAMMNDQVKQMVADEVQRQLAQARIESQYAAQNNMPPQASNGLPSTFTDNSPHALVVYNSIDVNNGAGGCPLSEGDVIAFNGNMPPGGDAMNVRVVSGSANSCPVGSNVQVQLADMMEMQNHLRATLDQGMEQMQANAGHGGLPALPSGSTGYVDTPMASAAPPPDPNAAQDINTETQQATQEELAVLNQVNDASGNTGGAGGGNAVSLGMSLDQVRGIVGNMRLVASIGNKQIYQAGDLKITFLDGRVSNVE